MSVADCITYGASTSHLPPPDGTSSPSSGVDDQHDREPATAAESGEDLRHPVGDGGAVEPLGLGQHRTHRRVQRELDQDAGGRRNRLGDRIQEPARGAVQDQAEHQEDQQVPVQRGGDGQEGFADELVDQPAEGQQAEQPGQDR